jgi:hypothetical protein
MDARLPWWADELAASLDTAGHAHSCRLMHFVKLVPWLHDGGAAQLQGRRVLVVGGGQSAAHLALLAAHKGAAVTMGPSIGAPRDYDESSCGYSSQHQ